MKQKKCSPTLFKEIWNQIELFLTTTYIYSYIYIFFKKRVKLNFKNTKTLFDIKPDSINTVKFDLAIKFKPDQTVSTPCSKF